MKYEYSSGAYYEGEIVNELFDGYGKFYFSNGDVYQGKFKNDKFEGYGVYYFKSGCIYKGMFSNDLFHGIGTFYFADGSLEKGKFHNDKRVGKFIQMDTKMNGFYEIIYQNDNVVKILSVEEANIPKEKNPCMEAVKSGFILDTHDGK